MAVGPWIPSGWAAAPPAPKPGTVPLRPLDVSDIVNGVFATIRRYPKPLYYPLLVVVLGSVMVLGGCAAVAYALVGPLPAHGAYMTDSQILGLTVAALALGVVLLICATVADAVATAVSTVVLRFAVLGRQLTARQAWAEARVHLWRVLGTRLLIGLGAVGILLVSALPSVLLGVVLASPTAAGYGLLLLIPGLAGTVYVGVRPVIAIPVLVLEEQRPTAAIRRAWRLNRGAWWRSLGTLYLIRMIGSVATQAITSLIAMLVTRFFSSAALTTAQTDPSARFSGVGFTLLVTAVCLVIALLMTIRAPLAPLTTGLLYLDRRFRLENLGPTLAIAAGVPSGSS